MSAGALVDTRRLTEEEAGAWEVERHNQANPAQGVLLAAPRPNLRIITVDLALLDADPDNERLDINVEDMPALMESIRTHGMLELPRVYEVVVAMRKRLRVESGHRRVQAARELGWSTIDAVLVPAPDGDVDRHLKRLITNVARRDIDVVLKARTLQALVEGGKSQRELATELGVSQSEVSNTLRLLRLPESVLEALREGRLSVAHGIELLRISEPLYRYAEQEPISVDAARAALGRWAEEGGQSLRALRREIDAEIAASNEVQGYRERRATVTLTRAADADPDIFDEEPTPDETSPAPEESPTPRPATWEDFDKWRREVRPEISERVRKLNATQLLTAYLLLTTSGLITRARDVLEDPYDVLVRVLADKIFDRLSMATSIWAPEVDEGFRQPVADMLGLGELRAQGPVVVR